MIHSWLSHLENNGISSKIIFNGDLNFPSMQLWSNNDLEVFITNLANRANAGKNLSEEKTAS